MAQRRSEGRLAAQFIKYHTDLVSHSDGLLLGRKTYSFFAAVWQSRSGELPDRFNSRAKYVASTALKDLEWENSHLLEGDVPEAVAKLKQQPGQDLIIYGSDDLRHSLLEHDLIDEYQLLVYPVVLGKGRSLFKDGVERTDLELVDTAVIPPGRPFSRTGRNEGRPLFSPRRPRARSRPSHALGPEGRGRSCPGWSRAVRLSPGRSSERRQ